MCGQMEVGFSKLPRGENIQGYTLGQRGKFLGGANFCFPKFLMAQNIQLYSILQESFLLSPLWLELRKNEARIF